MNLSQSDTAGLAHITGATVSGFERDDWLPSYNNLQAIQSALEAAGVVFVPANGGGPGVRLRRPLEAAFQRDAEISPDLCRAARYLVNLSQQDLATAAGLGRSTVAEFESGARVPTSNNLSAIRDALEAAGVSFIAADTASGPGVRLEA